jgi:hypothetical protein
VKRICAACKKKFNAKSAKYFLCPACAKIAFVDHKCPICGDGLESNRPVCSRCARSAMSAQTKYSTRCNFVKEDGEQCKSWALKGGYWCRHHQR